MSFQSAKNLAAVTCVFAMPGAFGQASRPPAGVDVDQKMEIRLLDTVPSPCISIRQSSVLILIPRSIIEASAANSPDPKTSEQARLAFIESTRAKGMLAQVVGQIDSSGCAPVAGRLSPDIQFLLASLLESGSAHLRDADSNAPIPSATVHYLGQRCGPTCGRGQILFSVAGKSTTFLVIDWWVS